MILSVRDDFDAVLLGIGAWISTGVGCPGEDAEGVIGGIDFLRKEQKAQVVSADEEMGVGAMLMADSYFDGEEVPAILQEAIAQLPEVQRTVFTLRYYEEMKYSEMSKLLDTSEGSLKASYHIAVKKISEYFHSRD